MRAILTAVIALVIAVGTTVLARGWLEAGRNRSAAAPTTPAVERSRVGVLVATSDLAPGTRLRPEQTRWQDWPESGVAAEYLVEGRHTVEEVAGAVVRFPMVAGQPLIRSMLIQPGERGSLAAVVQGGMRAVTVPIDETSGHAGLVVPGDHVDVILTQKNIRGPADPVGAGRTVSETVLGNVRVIATGRRLSGLGTEDASAAQSVRTATLEVTPEDAQRVALVSELGKLSLSLRGTARAEAPATDRASSVVTWDSAVSKALKDGEIQAPRIIVMRGGGGPTTVAATNSTSAEPAKEPQE